MIIQATPYGTAAEEPFAFTYSGDFTDERVDGIGDVTLNTSGVFEVLSGKATVQAYILGGGGGGACSAYHSVCATGGGGGYQTVEVTLEPGTYEITIGIGGAGKTTTERYQNPTSSPGGATTAFGKTSTGGGSAYAKYSGASGSSVGAGGTPNGGNGNKQESATNLSGGSPNGGGVTNAVAQAGGDGLVRLTFS